MVVNVGAVLGDRKLTATPGNYYGDIRSYSHPYPFGMPQPGRNWDRSGDTLYRYGYNGMETDGEVKEERGNHYTTYFRQYDPRLGRWWSNDPVVQPGESPYAAMYNNPILFSDPMGNHPPKGGDDPLEPKGYPTTGGRMVYVPSQNPVFRSDFLSILPTGGGVPSGTVATDDVLPANTPTQISQWIISYDAESGTFGGYWKTYRIEFSVIDGTLGEAGYYAADGSRYDDSPHIQV